MNRSTCTIARRWACAILSVASSVILPLAASAAEAPISPPPSFDVKDPGEFAKCVDTASAKLTKLAGGMKFIEGPVWVPDGGDGYLVFSDIPANELKKWSKADGLTTFRQPSDMVNGNTLDRDGHLISASHGKRVILRADKEGKASALVESFEGKRFNSPNDVAVKSDGTIWFTDPPYGLPKDQKPELDFHGVYRFDPKTKQVTNVTKEKQWPNGIAFSPDEKTLYVARSDGKNPIIEAFEVKPDGTVGEGKELCRLDRGIPDGIRVDAEGRIWSSAGDGVHVFSNEGKLLGKILVPESPANLAFGGKDGNTLFITARTSLYSIPVKVKGAGSVK
jgi:gluconolactonase